MYGDFILRMRDTSSSSGNWQIRGKTYLWLANILKQTTLDSLLKYTLFFIRTSNLWVELNVLKYFEDFSLKCS